MPEEWQLMDEKHRIDNFHEHLQYRSKLLSEAKVTYTLSGITRNTYWETLSFQSRHLNASAIMIIEISVINDMGCTCRCMH